MGVARSASRFAPPRSHGQVRRPTDGGCPAAPKPLSPRPRRFSASRCSALAGAATAAASSTTRHRGVCGSSSSRSTRSSSREQRLRRRCRAAARARARRRSRASSSLNGQRAASLARASAIASVLATPCQNSELMPEPADIELVRDAVFCLVNRVRAENGEMPSDTQLTARTGGRRPRRGNDLRGLLRACLSHRRDPGRPHPRHRLPAGRPQVGYVIGENLAWGTLSLATP